MAGIKFGLFITVREDDPPVSFTVDYFAPGRNVLCVARHITEMLDMRKPPLLQQTRVNRAAQQNQTRIHRADVASASEHLARGRRVGIRVET